jgi:glyoxylase-like metal-dependent hydrolase (beta-lactamase superfamily II)
MLSAAGIARVVIATVVAASAALAVEVPANAAAPLQEKQSASFYRMKLGDFEVTALYDGGGEIDAKLLHAEPADIQSLMRRELGDAQHIKGTVAAFLVNTGKKLILVDTGTGGHWGGPSLGKVGANLERSGYSPEQVDIVLLTHLHADHVGGIYSAQGGRLFPNAEVRMANADSDFWLSAETAKQAPKEAQLFFTIARDAAAPYIAAHKWMPFAGIDEIVSGVRPVPISGHTPGHTGYEFTSQGKTMLVWGDVVHVAAVQLPHPEIGIDYDADGPAAIKARQQLFEALAAKETFVAGAHMPFPSLGQLRREGAGYVWVPVIYTDTP